MLVAVIGGNLQGVEATYLSHKAGWEVMVIDKNSAVPASGLCDSFVQLDVTSEIDLGQSVRGVDIVIPALEDDDALAILGRFTKTKDIPYVFDSRAYSISASKAKSNRLFAQLGVPAPKSWPNCGFPVMAKPNKGSGSAGIRILDDLEELRCHFPGSMPFDNWVLQEFLTGHSYSQEVIGFSGQYRALPVTDLAMDAAYDCKRVLAPTELGAKLVAEFGQTSVAIAEAMELRGLMDVEVILNSGVAKVLEVDARLPSQTPTAVYWSTGLNMVQMLGEFFLHGSIKFSNSREEPQGVVYEHIRVSPNLLEVAGEHIMTGTGPLQIRQDFFGADEAITNYAHSRGEWMATLIISGTDRGDAWAKRCHVIEEIRDRFGLQTYFDPSPDD
jgi:pyrrolysine biosynthesis protein PylC